MALHIKGSLNVSHLYFRIVFFPRHDFCTFIFMSRSLSGGVLIIIGREENQNIMFFTQFPSAGLHKAGQCHIMPCSGLQRVRFHLLGTTVHSVWVVLCYRGVNLTNWAKTQFPKNNFSSIFFVRSPQFWWRILFSMHKICKLQRETGGWLKITSWIKNLIFAAFQESGTCKMPLTVFSGLSCWTQGRLAGWRWWNLSRCELYGELELGWVKSTKKIPYHPFIFFQVQIVPSLFINLHFTLTAFRIFRILSPSPSLVRHFSLVKEKSETKLSRWLDTPDQYTALPSRDHCTKLALAGGDRSTGDCTTKKKHMATQKYRTIDRLCFHILILIPWKFRKSFEE